MGHAMPINRHLILLFASLALASLVDMVRALSVDGLGAGGSTSRSLVITLVLLVAILVLTGGQKDLILIPRVRQQAAAGVLIAGWVWTVWAWVHGVTHAPISATVAHALLFGLMALVIVSGRMALGNAENAGALPEQEETEHHIQAAPGSKGGLLDFLGTDRQRTIIQHMTDAERAEYARLGGQQGTWVAQSFAIPIALAWAFVGQIGWPISAAISAVALAVFIRGAIPRRRAAYRFIESTQWARLHRD